MIGNSSDLGAHVVTHSSSFEPVATAVYQLLQTCWETLAKTLHLMICVDVFRALCEQSPQCCLLGIKRSTPRERVFLQVSTDPGHGSLVRQNIWYIGRLMRRILGRERSEVVLLQSFSIILANVSCGALIETRTAVRCNHMWHRFTSSTHNPQHTWDPVNKLRHPLRILLPTIPHDFDVYSTTRQHDKPPYLPITELFLLPAIWRRPHVACVQLLVLRHPAWPFAMIGPLYVKHLSSVGRQDVVARVDPHAMSKIPSRRMRIVE